MSLSSLNLTGQEVLELESGNEMWMDRRTDRQTDKQTDGITPISKGT